MLKRAEHASRPWSKHRGIRAFCGKGSIQVETSVCVGILRDQRYVGRSTGGSGDYERTVLLRLDLIFGEAGGVFGGGLAGSLLEIPVE